MTKKVMKFNGTTLTCIYSFLIPITPWYCNIFGISAINLITILYIGLSAIVLGKSLSIKGKRIDRKIVFLFIIFYLSRTVSLLKYGNIVEPLWLLLRTATTYWFFSSSIKTREAFLKVIKTILLASFVVSIFGIIEEVTHFNVFSLVKPMNYEFNYNPSRFGILRIIGFAEHTIVYSVYLMFCLCLCLYYMQFINSQRKIFYKILYVMLWTNILLSLSRSAIICAIISQIIILYYSDKKQFLINVLKIMLCGIVAIMILSLVSSKVAQAVRNVLYMVMAVFNDDYTSIIASTFGEDNLLVQGDRINLYEWVLSKMDGVWFFGFGMNAQFSYSYTRSNGVWTWTAVKENIEVHYLDVLFRYGIFGLITNILLYLKLLYMSVINKKNNWDKKLSFNKTMFAAFLAYYIQLFAVNQTTERNLFYIIVFLFLLYNSKSFRERSLIGG